MLYRWFPSILKAITIIRPETLVRWLLLDRPRETSEIDRQERVAIDVDAAAGYRARKENVDLCNGTGGNVAIQSVSQPVRETRNRLNARGHWS
jgi:hypothetical protein